MEQTTLIFLPDPSLGHVLATLEFGVQLLNQNPELSIHMLIITFATGLSFDYHIQSIASSQPRLKVSKLPIAEPPPPEVFNKSIEKYVCDYIDSHSHHVRNAVSEIVLDSSSRGARVSAFVTDFFCISMIDVAHEFCLKTYIFLPSSAAFLRFMQFLATRSDDESSPFAFSDPDCKIAGFQNRVPVNVLPSFCFNGEGGYAAMLHAAKRFNEVNGFVINTFEELETSWLRLKETEQDIYAVGPLIDFKGYAIQDKGEPKTEAVIDWLDKQPESSVVFICFGSHGAMSEWQIKEIAKGIERSEQRFVWQMRIKVKEESGSTERGAEDALPEGFVERTRERGMICGWVKQVEILGHRAIGGFVSHCGWNSTLESLWHGVPQATLPLAAEQQLNAFAMVKDLGLSVELKVDYRGGLSHVSAEQVERAVADLMDGDSELKSKVKGMRAAAREAVKKGGSSFSALQRFARDSSR